MTRTKLLRKQHEDIEIIAKELLHDSRNIQNWDDAKLVHRKLLRLDSLLTTHLNSEDYFLYPEMVSSDDYEASTVATRFATEMGGLASRYNAFKIRWTSAEQLQINPIGFQSELRTILAALFLRIKMENAELFPLADRLLGREAA